MRCSLQTYGLLVFILGPALSICQEMDSTSLFTDSYTDRFQEVFFEALKQKGIENYDRAREQLLEAKKLDPLNPVVDHELARVRFQEKQYGEAGRYALEALKAQPEEYWYLETFMTILDKQQGSLSEYLSVLPAESPVFRRNLAHWYLQAGSWDRALEQLRGLPDTEEVKQMRNAIERNRAMAVEESEKALPLEKAVETEEGSVAHYEGEIKELLEQQDWPSLGRLSGEALEIYPLQPYFYYARGVSLLRLDKPEGAVRILEAGEALLLDDSQVARLIYASLAEAHASLGNEEKARKYQDKLKSGS